MIKFFDTITRFVILSTLVFYVGGSWSSASFNLNHWDEDTRGVYAGLWTTANIVGAFYTVIALLFKESQNKKP